MSAPKAVAAHHRHQLAGVQVAPRQRQLSAVGVAKAARVEAVRACADGSNEEALLPLRDDCWFALSHRSWRMHARQAMHAPSSPARLR